jgi:hypothetical protein
LVEIEGYFSLEFVNYVCETEDEIEVSVYLNQSEILAGNNSIFLQLPGESRDV